MSVFFELFCFSYRRRILAGILRHIRCSPKLLLLSLPCRNINEFMNEVVYWFVTIYMSLLQ